MTYLELKTAVINWLDHLDSQDLVPQFVELARAKINRKLMAREMTCVGEAVGVADQTDYDLPADWAGARQVSVDGLDLEYLTPELFTNDLKRERSSALFYTIRANKIRFSSAPGEGATIELVYYRKVPELVEDTDTNWLLENHPDCWLYLAVAEGHRYVMDEERMATMTAAGYGVMYEIMDFDWNERWSAGTMRIHSV